MDTLGLSFRLFIRVTELLTPRQLATVSIANSIQCYSTLTFTKRVYSGQPEQVTPLSARTFGTWTFVSAIVRLYAAYHINEPHMYQLAFAMFVGAYVHFMSEWLYFKTAKWGAGLTGPIVISTVSVVWMLAQWDYYTNL
jgi:hypothetical protein